MKRAGFIIVALALIMAMTVVALIAEEIIPPTVSTKAATGVSTDSATLNGNLDDLGNYSSGNVSFQYATHVYYINNGNTYDNETTTQTMDTIGPFSEILSSLTLGTVYHFRAKAIGDSTVYGSDMEFTTKTTLLVQMRPMPISRRRR
jgi:hypothetical protein